MCVCESVPVLPDLAARPACLAVNTVLELMYVAVV